MTNEQRARIKKIQRDAKVSFPKEGKLTGILPDGTEYVFMPVKFDITQQSLALASMRRDRNN